MIGGGNMGKNGYESQASSSSFKFNGVVRVLECLCPRICVVRKPSTSKNPGRPFYACPLPKVCLNNEKRLKMIEKCNLSIIILPSY